MIHKIDHLCSIGKFRNYRASGDVAFKKLTVVYADNGSGKTTLTSVLRSLTLNLPEIILKRKSTNAIGAQSVKIIQRVGATDTHHTFGARGWTLPLANIEIFDIHFVNDNVYSGFEFNDNHKKHLCQFVIGAQGVAIQRQIEENKTDKSTSRQVQESLERQLIQLVGNDLQSSQITAFLNITVAQSKDLDKKIAEAEATLTSATSQAFIQTLQSLSKLDKFIFNVDIQKLEEVLQTTTKVIQDETLKKIFEKHCKDLADNNVERPESWIREGYYFLEIDNNGEMEEKPLSMTCPFCTQPISNALDIFNAYTLWFNEEFNSLIKNLEEYKSSLSKIQIDVSIQKAEAIHKLNSAQLNSWRAYLSSTIIEPAFDIFPESTGFSTEFMKVTGLVDQKLQNPSNSVDVSDLKTFGGSLQAINQRIDAYNKLVDEYNKGITNFKTTLKSVAQAQSELNVLKRIKKRFEPAIDKICNQLKAERQSLRTLEATYTQLVQQQQVASNSFFNNYKDRINFYLTNVFKTYFKIEDVRHVPPQGRATYSKIGYTLTIDGHDISFDPAQPNSAKECLSEGDKSTIALAFFLSKLDVDSGLSDKILVFDDPLSSFDTNRRLFTIQLIRNTLPRIKQAIVLSHNENFLYDLSKDIPASDKKVLRITENVTAKASIIEPLDLDALVENEYFKHVKELENFLTRADISKRDTVLGWMRNVLEAHIRFKFYRQTSHLPNNSRTLGTLITTLEQSGVLFRDNVHRNEILQKLRVINGISCKPHHGEPKPDYLSLAANPDTMTAAELAYFVQDTLDLVDNRL